MSEIASAKINSFGKSPKANFVSPSEQLITLTIGQLQDLVTQAVERAIQPLKDEVETLRAIITSLDTKVSTLESTQETQADNSLIQLRLINDLRSAAKKEVQPGNKTKDRAKRINNYMLSRSDHKASFEALRGFLEVNAVLLNLAIATLMKDAPGQYAIVKDRSDKRKRFLAVIPKIS
jgi:hypothetical protein